MDAHSRTKEVHPKAMEAPWSNGGSSLGTGNGTSPWSYCAHLRAVGVHTVTLELLSSKFEMDVPRSFTVQKGRLIFMFLFTFMQMYMDM
jgi:hypothetical protein